MEIIIHTADGIKLCSDLRPTDIPTVQDILVKVFIADWWEK